MTDLQWETNGGRYILRGFVPAEWTDQKYTEYFYKRMKEELGLKLFDILQSTRNPTTIEFLEHQKEVYSNESYVPGYGNVVTGVDGTEIAFELRCTPVTYRNIIMPRMTYDLHDEKPKEKQPEPLNEFIAKLMSIKLLSKVLKTLHK